MSSDRKKSNAAAGNASSRPAKPAAEAASYHPRRPRRSIKLDRIHPSDFAKYDIAFFCDQCSHYDGTNRYCTMGYRPQHTREEQMAIYNLSGKMALCRFLEID